VVTDECRLLGCYGVFLAKNRRFGGTKRLHLATLMIEALLSSKPSVLTRSIRRNIAEDSCLHSHRRRNLKS
jgi:hypothetical protein